jgi:hypothetical protein
VSAPVALGGTVLTFQGHIHDDILFQLSQLFSTSWKVFSGGPRLFLMVQMTTPVTLASSQIFSLIMQVCFACNVILMQIVHHICFIHHRKCFQVDWGYFQVFGCQPSHLSQFFSLITQVCLACKVILNQITCFESHGEFLKSWILGWTEVILRALGVNTNICLLIPHYKDCSWASQYETGIPFHWLWDRDFIHRPTR